MMGGKKGRGGRKGNEGVHLRILLFEPWQLCTKRGLGLGLRLRLDLGL